MPDLNINQLIDVTFSYIRKADLNFIANITSLLGFLLTVFILINIRKIRVYYEFRLRAPALIKRVREIAHNVSLLLNNFSENEFKIQEAYSKIEGILPPIKKTLKRKQKKPITRLLRSITVKNQNLDEVGCRDIYLEIQKNIEMLKNIYVEVTLESEPQ